MGFLLAGVVAAIETGRPYLLLPLCQLGVSLGGLELAWLCFRVRARLLLALQAAITASDDQESPQGTETGAPTRPDTSPAAVIAQEGYRCALQAAATPTGFAVKWLADKTPVTHGKDIPVALAVSLLAAAAVVSLVVVCLPLLASLPEYQTPWWLVVVAGGVGTFSAALTACLAPTGADSVLMLVLQGCFTFSRMNMVVAHHKNSLHSDPEVIDDLYLTLTGCCVMIAWRVVSSTDVMQTLFVALLDTFVLVYLLATMMEIGDFVDHPYAKGFPFFFSTFFLAVSAGEVARWAFRALASDGNAHSSRWRLRASRRRAGERCVPFTRTVGAALVSAASACFVTAISVACIPRRYPTKPGLLAMFPVAAVVAQLGEAVLAMLKETALVSRRSRLSAWNNGVLDAINPFLLAWIVVHPYSKHMLASASSYEDGSSSG